MAGISIHAETDTGFRPASLDAVDSCSPTGAATILAAPFWPVLAASTPTAVVGGVFGPVVAALGLRP